MLIAWFRFPFDETAQVGDYQNKNIYHVDLTFALPGHYTA
jgi:hypothetical protein